MEPSEIQVEENRFYRLFQKFSQESRLVVLVSICMIATLFNVLVSVLALDGEKEVSLEVAKLDMKVELEFRYNEKYVTELTDEVEVWQIYAAKLHADLIAHGFKPPSLPEE